MDFNRAERYPHGYLLSIQYSRSHYSTPRTDGLDPRDVSEVEVAIIAPDGRFLNPTEIDCPEAEEHWEQSAGGSNVGAFVPWAVVDNLRRALLSRPACKS